MVTAAAKTNGVGYTISGDQQGIGDFKVSEVGHGSRGEVYKQLTSANKGRYVIHKSKHKNLKMQYLCEALTDFGFDEYEPFIRHDNSRMVVTKKKRKDGTFFDPYRSNPTHIWVDFTRKLKDIRVMMDGQVLRVGVHNGTEYEYYRTVSMAKRFI